jgi:hypothetical protein
MLRKYIIIVPVRETQPGTSFRFSYSRTRSRAELVVGLFLLIGELNASAMQMNKFEQQI